MITFKQHISERWLDRITSKILVKKADVFINPTRKELIEISKMALSLYKERIFRGIILDTGYMYAWNPDNAFHADVISELLKNKNLDHMITFIGKLSGSKLILKLSLLEMRTYTRWGNVTSKESIEKMKTLLAEHKYLKRTFSNWELRL